MFRCLFEHTCYQKLVFLLEYFRSLALLKKLVCYLLATNSIYVASSQKKYHVGETSSHEFPIEGGKSCFG
jgi:hypothetical protein